MAFTIHQDMAEMLVSSAHFSDPKHYFHLLIRILYTSTAFTVATIAINSYLINKPLLIW